MPDCALQAAAMPDHTYGNSLPSTAQYQVTHSMLASLHSPLTQQVPGHAAPTTGRGQMELLLCVNSGFHSSCPLPFPSAAPPVCTDRSHFTVSLQLMLLPCLNPGHCN